MREKEIITSIVLKNGFRYSGSLISETSTEIILHDIKSDSKVFIDKSSISARVEKEVENGS